MKRFEVIRVDDDLLEVRRGGNTFEATIVKEIKEDNQFYSTMEAIYNDYKFFNFDSIIETLWDKL